MCFNSFGFNTSRLFPLPLLAKQAVLTALQPCIVTQDPWRTKTIAIQKTSTVLVLQWLGEFWCYYFFMNLADSTLTNASCRYITKKSKTSPSSPQKLDNWIRSIFSRGLKLERCPSYLIRISHLVWSWMRSEVYSPDQ